MALMTLHVGILPDSHPDFVTDELTISVFDSRRDACFELPARRENALDVFNHPYAYAALLGIELPDEPALAA